MPNIKKDVGSEYATNPYHGATHINLLPRRSVEPGSVRSNCGSIWWLNSLNNFQTGNLAQVLIIIK
jgi:hypothetical protein